MPEELRRLIEEIDAERAREEREREKYWEEQRKRREDDEY